MSLAHRKKRNWSTKFISYKSIKAINNKFIPCIIPRRRIRKKKNRSTTLITRRG